MSRNIFADIGMPEPQTELLKAQLVHQLAELIRVKGLTQQKAAELLGIDQPKVSALLRGHWEGFSVERLIRFINSLNRDVHIVIGSEDMAEGEAKTRVVIG